MEKFNQLCVWPATLVGVKKIKEFETFILKNLGARVKYVEEVKTLPDKDKLGNTKPGTGNRNDVLFYIHDEDISRFAIKRLAYGIRWWEDVLANNKNIYPNEVLKKYPKRW